MSKQKRIYSKYKVKIGHTIVHGGMTKNLPKRTRQHLSVWPDGHVVKVGNRCTKNGALAWERANGYQSNCSD